MSPRSAGWLAWGACLLTVAVSTVSLILLVLTPDTGGLLSRPEARSTQAGAVVVPVAGATIGALVAWRRPANPFGWLALGGFLSARLVALAYDFARYVELAQANSSVGQAFGWLGWLTNVLWVPAVSLVPLAGLLFPTGRLPSTHWRPVAWAVALGPALLVLATVLYPDPLDVTTRILVSHAPARLLTLQSPFAVGGAAGDILKRTVPVALLLFMPAAVLTSATSVLLRYRRATREERQQIKWVAYASGLVVVLWSVALTGVFGAWRGAAVVSVGGTALMVSCAIAILKHRLFDIDLLIHRTLVYGALTAFVVGVYVLVVGGLGAVFQTGGNVAISLLATGLIAVLFQPGRERLQRAVNHLLYGQRDEPYAVLSRLGQRMEATLAPEAVLPSIVETVREALKLPYVAIALRQADGLALAAAAGHATGHELAMPLAYQHDTVGELRLAPRGPGEEFSPTDRRLLDDLARQAGVAAYAVRLTAELQRSRERLVTAREEERRRLRRDLHDELAPTLAALALTAATARDRAVNDPATVALLDELYGGLRSAVGDIRRLVYELRPPALDELGLVAALRERAAQYTAAERNGLHVVVEAPQQLPPLPAAVEVAAYRIVQEALMNVARHAEARNCCIRLALKDGLEVEVTDDGRGLPRTHRAGVGLRSMRERALELGGRCSIERLNGAGTRVFAWLPVERSESDGATADPPGG